MFFVLLFTFVVMKAFEIKLDNKNHEFEFSKIYIMQFISDYLIIGALFGGEDDRTHLKIPPFLWFRHRPFSIFFPNFFLSGFY